jgi:hypothetical protein
VHVDANFGDDFLNIFKAGRNAAEGFSQHEP